MSSRMFTSTWPFMKFTYDGQMKGSNSIVWDHITKFLTWSSFGKKTRLKRYIAKMLYIIYNRKKKKSQLKIKSQTPMYTKQEHVSALFQNLANCLASCLQRQLHFKHFCIALWCFFIVFLCKHSRWTCFECCTCILCLLQHLRHDMVS